MPSIHEILKEYWGYDAFRPLQEDIIHHVLEGKDALALLPTGGGKSLCFQVPALAQEGICIVVSPLIALMKDQVENLKKRGILAAAIYTGMSRRAIVQTLKNVAHGPYKFLYVSPERLETGLFQEYLPAMDVNLIAIDEAHCISQWGHDFRPAYRRIAALREELPDVPVLALTASATAEVQQDILTQLALRNAPTFRQPFLRPNLSYSVLKVEAKPAKIVDIIGKVPGTAIVYARSRRRTVEIADLLRMHGHSAEHYHAGLPAAERAKRQQDWIENRTRVMVCTNAFGMGIDKPDVRLVVHADIPDSLESYYQEAGRAGRDGLKSYAVLLYTPQDIRDLDALHEQRYPSFEEIKAVYSALVNFLQIPSYTGEDRSYTFHYDTFVRNFGLDPFRALYALKALEGEGWFDYNDRSYMPPTVTFQTNKRGLNEFQEAHPDLEPLLTTLLRTYAGIFDVPVFVSELQVAQLMGVHIDEVTAGLKRAAAFGVIDYTPQNEDPKLVFRRHRVNVDDFRMNTAPYEARRAHFRARVGQMISYTSAEECRSQFINHYFGESDGPACGICDRCLARKKKPLDGADFERIRVRVEGALADRPLTVDLLLAALGDVGANQLWPVLDFLQAEQRLRMDGNGLLTYR
ncbi:RecQ family ATP-dependent DNA helicase [Flaviaesturariibacter aridisoli]|uniref:ATP-dependent DNA helicase RecQ n=1 Tax=Flaviaesturariibacter aridisoli TaxID=2545761 RepID=A0A4R4E9P1_9BACT|nr:ATP-dependent DNA helicase RecQ [Flaviaesturariibacter aridisoli]TCZ74821.1 RecQ family ATP-dependent DNA helicase [Flaviaesturariibacter aridisoli]